MPSKRTTRRTSRRGPPRRSPPRKPPAARAPSAPPSGTSIPFEFEIGGFEDTLEKLRSELVRWANKGRYSKVRFKFRGRQLLPDIPLAAVVAAEGLSFYWAGLLRALVVNIAGGALIDVEMVNDSEKVIAQG